MSENNPEVSVRKKGRRLKEKAALTVAAVGAAGIGFLGVDREARPVTAAGETPTVIPTRTITPTATVITPTPDAKATQIAALKTAIAQAEEERRRDKIIEELKAKATALAVTSTSTPKSIDTPKPIDTPRPADTPTPTSTPDVRATQEAADKAAIQELADRKAAATARAEATVIAKTPPKPIPTYAVNPESGGGNPPVSIPLENVAEGLGALIALGVLYRFRRGVVDLARRGAGWVKGRFGGGGGHGGGGAPAGGGGAGGGIPLAGP